MTAAEALLQFCTWLAAPSDGSPLMADGDMLRATGDGTRYTIEGGIPRLMVPEDRAAAERAHRARMERKEQSAMQPVDVTILRTLPYASRPDDAPGLWYRKKAAWESLERALQSVNFFAGAPHVVDMGAGIGWLSRRFALLGASVVALDNDADSRSALGAAVRIAGDPQAPFLPVQATFTHPPILTGAADLVVYCDSLPDTFSSVLARGATMLRRGGFLAIMDSPVADEADGTTTPTQAAIEAALHAEGLTVREWMYPPQDVARLLSRFTARRTGAQTAHARALIIAEKTA